MGWVSSTLGVHAPPGPVERHGYGVIAIEYLVPAPSLADQVRGFDDSANIDRIPVSSR